MTRLNRYIIFPLLLLFLTACNSAMPSGFWQAFKAESKLEDISDQGPWGGHRAIHWKSTQNGAFDLSEVLAFAEENGWTLADSTVYKSQVVATWLYASKAIFPLSHSGFTASNQENASVYAQFPRWMHDDIRLYKFETNWITTTSGEEKTNPAYGYVLINQESSEMAGYHLWGE